ncbi:hypothetical protein [Brenneria uluponensis]|uniref:hypothetical protein n=1 Tax=Brenneria uluponensis TaxID=3057057 RepID=UPI0028E95A59|nr:hypothetical protein [Brenneria ulupoensis]
MYVGIDVIAAVLGSARVGFFNELLHYGVTLFFMSVMPLNTFCATVAADEKQCSQLAKRKLMISSMLRMYCDGNYSPAARSVDLLPFI